MRVRWCQPHTVTAHCSAHSSHSSLTIIAITLELALQRREGIARIFNSLLALDRFRCDSRPVAGQQRLLDRCCLLSVASRLVSVVQEADQTRPARPDWFADDIATAALLSRRDFQLLFPLMVQPCRCPLPLARGHRTARRASSSRQQLTGRRH